MNHSWTRQQEWAADKVKLTDKNASKVGIKHDDAKWDISAANDKWSVKVSGPVVTDDWKVSGSVLYEDKPGSAWKVEAASNIVSPDMSGVKAFVNVSDLSSPVRVCITSSVQRCNYRCERS